MTDVQDQVRELERTAVVSTTNGPVQGYREDILHDVQGPALCRAAARRAAVQAADDGLRPGPRSPMPWRSARRRSRSASRPARSPAAAARGDPPAPGQPGTDEDCLFINVWTPGLTGKRPVMVWLHGGGFANGSGGAAMYDGEATSPDAATW